MNKEAPVYFSEVTLLLAWYEMRADFRPLVRRTEEPGKLGRITGELRDVDRRPYTPPCIRDIRYAPIYPKCCAAKTLGALYNLANHPLFFSASRPRFLEK